MSDLDEMTKQRNFYQARHLRLLDDSHNEILRLDKKIEDQEKDIKLLWNAVELLQASHRPKLLEESED